MVDEEVTWIVQVADDCGLVGSMSLVGSVDGSFFLPVCPVDVILKHSDTSDVVLTHNYGNTKPKEYQYYKINQLSIINTII